MRLVFCALALSAAAYASVISGSAESNPVRTHPHSVDAGTDTYRIIVKLRSSDTAVAAAAQAPAVSPHERIANLAGRSGLKLEDTRQIFDRMHLVQVQPDAGASLADTVSRLQSDSEVEYAVPDERRYIHAVPDDPLYSLGGQWYEQADSQTPSAVDAQSAWDYTTGDPNLVIADLDTGVRFDHPDLQAAANSGRLLPGYDFISDPAIANDGDGRDPDASDPGDWVNSADQATSRFKSCDIHLSSWHGTRTAGILGALTNNAHGMSGMTWQGKILPVRVLGKCGGYDSDVIAGMMWAAGMDVPGVPVNTHPARIINMSLGSSAPCPATYSDIIGQLVSVGVLVVVSAGNEGGPVDAPANCPGVAAIAGLRHAGTKVGFSSLGPEVAVSAPAGNCINQIGTCVYSMQTTTNSGTAAPVVNDDVYTGTQITLDEVPTGPNLGTSFSAPVVSGIAALMLAVNSNLNACQLTSRLKEGSVTFPQTSSTQPAPPVCHVPSGTTDLQDTECICTLDGKTCGAGMANAKGAVLAALRPIAAVSFPASVSVGQSVSLKAQGSAAVIGHRILSYQWSSVGNQAVAIQNANSQVATVPVPSCGLATVQLTVTDDVSRVDTANVILDPTSVTSSAPSNATGAACTVGAPKVRVEVCPSTGGIQVGGTQTFVATVANTTNDSVSWQVNGIAGGNATFGTISSTGVYTAPSSGPPSLEVTITAVSNADKTVSATSTLNVANGSGAHGGAMDPMTLSVEAIGLGLVLARRWRRRAGVSLGS